MIVIPLMNRQLKVSRYRAGVVIGVVWTATIAVALLLLYLGFDAYSKAKTRLVDQATTYAHLIAEHDSFGFQLADLVLRDMMDDLTWDDYNGPLTPSKRREEVYQKLIHHRDRVPGIASFTIVGADGIRRMGIVNKNGTDLSKRPYFIAIKNGKDLFISNVEDGQASGKAGIHVARRFNGPDGSFGGLVVMNLAAQDVFFSFYKSITLGPNASTSLRDSTRVLIRYPSIDRQPSYGRGGPPADQVGVRIAAGEDRGILVGVDPLDGIEKITAFERLASTGIYATVSLPVKAAMSGPTMAAVASFIAALAMIFGAYGVGSAIKKSYALAKARDEAIEAGEERQRLIRRLNTAIEDERKNIAIEIHDVLNAILIGIRLDAQGILGTMTQAQHTPVMDEVVERAKSITSRANDLYANCRAIVTRLRPEVLDVLGLDEAIEEMVKNYNASHPSCTFTFSSSGDAAGIDPNIAIAAYRIAQEALSNVVKHAEAQHADVSLKLQDNELRLAVMDDGRGFSPRQEATGFGLIGMRERVAAFGGTLEVQAAPNNGGSCVIARIPLKGQTATA